MRTTRLPPSSCPRCGRVEDAHTSATGGKRPPGPGDVAICFYCLAVNVYADDLGLRTPTGAEMDELRASEVWPTVRAALVALQRAKMTTPPPTSK